METLLVFLPYKSLSALEREADNSYLYSGGRRDTSQTHVHALCGWVNAQKSTLLKDLPYDKSVMEIDFLLCASFF